MAEYLDKEDMSTGEYISRDVALRQLNATCSDTNCNNYNGVMCRACPYADTMDIIDAIPAADVQPVKRGQWKDHHCKHIEQLDANLIQAKCTYCGIYSDKIERYCRRLDLEYCSHCGADMTGGE